MKKILIILILPLFVLACVTTDGISSNDMEENLVFEDVYDNIVQFDESGVYDATATEVALDLFFKTHPAVFEIHYEIPGEAIKALNPYHSAKLKTDDPFAITDDRNNVVDINLEAAENFFEACKEVNYIIVGTINGEKPGSSVTPFTERGGEITYDGIKPLRPTNDYPIINFGALVKGKVTIVNDPSISKYSFVYYIPEDLDMSEKTRIILWGHGGDGSYSEIVENRANMMKSRVCWDDDYGFIYIAVIIPFGAQYFSRTNIIEPGKNEFWNRPDLEYRKVLNTFMDALEDDGYDVHRKVFMTGFSNGGIQAQILPILHPDLIEATAPGGAGSYLFPTDDYDYPYGMNDFELIEDTTYSDELYRGVEHFVFVGEKDVHEINDPVKSGEYTDFCGELQKDRVPVFTEELVEFGVDAEYKVYEQYGHEFENEMYEDIFAFFDSIEIK